MSQEPAAPPPPESALAPEPAPPPARTPASAWVGLTLPVAGVIAAWFLFARLAEPADHAGGEWGGLGSLIVLAGAGLAGVGVAAGAAVVGLFASLMAFGERRRTVVTWLALLANLAVLLPLALAVLAAFVAAAVR